jgi:hypothetical protein
VGVTEIESAITQLPAKDFAELMAWLDKYRQEAWDRQIGNDLAAGRLDAVLAEAEAEYRQGRAKPL